MIKTKAWMKYIITLSYFLHRQNLRRPCSRTNKKPGEIVLLLFYHLLWGPIAVGQVSAEVVDGSVAGAMETIPEPHHPKRDYAKITLRIELPVVSSAEKAAWAKGAETYPLQIGFGRDLPADCQGDLAPRLTWAQQPDGSVIGALSVVSPGAQSLRVAVQAVLPAGAELRFFSPADPEQHFPPFKPQDFSIAPDEPLWSPLIEGDTLGLEISLPSAVAISSLSLSIKRVSHLVASATPDSNPT